MWRVASVIVAVIASTMLAAWLLQLDLATRTETLAPMSPLACVGFLAAATGLWALPDGGRTTVVAGVLAGSAGAAGLVDVILTGGDGFNRGVFGAPVRISILTASALLVLGVAIALDGRDWPVTQKLALAAGAIAGAAVIGFLLGVPVLYGTTRSIQMSWQAAFCTLLVVFGLVAAHRPGILFADTLSGRFARRTVPAVLGVPIASGAFATAAARAGWWPFSVAAWVMTLAAVAGLAAVVAMAVTRLAEEDRRLTELAIRDPLTGAYNRRHFLIEAERAAARVHRYGEAAALAVVDLDHFKEVNDEWGHAAGDEALIRSYRALRGRLRSSDVIGRIGGDEFAAVLLHVDADGAARVADEMREAVRAVGLELEREGRHNRLGASVGIAPLDGGNMEDLIELADRRMYEEKRLGKEVQSGADH